VIETTKISGWNYEDKWLELRTPTEISGWNYEPLPRKVVGTTKPFLEISGWNYEAVVLRMQQKGAQDSMFDPAPLRLITRLNY